VNRIRSPLLAAPRSRIFTRDTSTRTNTGLNGAFRTMTVTNKTIAAVRKLEVPHRLEEGLRLKLDGLRQ
jgi:hypothetical protein